MPGGGKLSFRLATQEIPVATTTTPMQRSCGLPVTPMVPLPNADRRWSGYAAPTPVTAVAASAPGLSKLSFSLGHLATTTRSAGAAGTCSTCQKPCVFSVTETLPFPTASSVTSTPIGRQSPFSMPTWAQQPGCQKRAVAQTSGVQKQQPDFDFPPKRQIGVVSDMCEEVDTDEQGRVMGESIDLYTVPEGKGLYLVNLVHAVMCRVCCAPPLKREKGRWNYVVGKEGHLERFSAWSHLIAFLAFVTYGITRHVVYYRSSTSFGWATGAAIATAMTFLSSTVYHVTSPDARISMITRQLDFLAIYVSIAICSVADLSAVTRGFVNVPIVSIIDVPIAATILALFFAFRRYELSCDDTLRVDYAGCTFGVGLFRRWHTDGSHTPLRQASSFAIASFYFTVTPAVLENSLDAGLILGLQGAALTMVIGGMLLDNVSGWPDAVWHKNPNGVPCTSFPRMGCMLSSHGLWHLLAVVGAVMTAVAREYAVFNL
jgi:predicted membrane channel-forming protein YqfA (hemolysin III family)